MRIAIDIFYGLASLAGVALAARYVAPGITGARKVGRSADVALYVKATFVLGAFAGCFMYLLISDLTR